MSKDDVIAEYNPAFPTQSANKYFHGMSLRDYFAAKAMAALLCRDEWDVNGKDGILAHYSYAVADAMLAERNKE